MPMLDEKVKQEVKKILENMVKPITIKLFTQEMECGYCKETHDLLNDVASLNAKISLQIHDFAKDTEAVAKYGIEQRSRNIRGRQCPGNGPGDGGCCKHQAGSVVDAPHECVDFRTT